MLTPLPLPKAPEAAASVLTDALADLAEDGPVSREAALGVFRRHQARMQQHVQHAFEQDQISGLQAARLLGKLTDGLISSL
jgi:[protein-PII] uridylyltransferase